MRSHLRSYLRSNGTTRISPARVILSLTVVLLVLSGCESSGDGSGIAVEDLHLTTLPGGAKIISGSVHNGLSEEVAGVLVQISLFDDENNLLTSMTVAVEGIAAGGDQRFREPIDSDLDVQRARVKKLITL